MNQRALSPISYSFRAIAVLLACLVFTSCSGQKHRLAFKVYLEDSFIVYFTGTQELTVKSDDTQAKTFSWDVKLAYKFNATSVDKNGNTWFEVTVQSAKMPAFQAVLGAAVEGKSFALQMAPDGQVVDFKRTEELREQVFPMLNVPNKLVSPSGNADEIERFAKRLLVEISDDALKARFERVFRIWPSTPATVSDSWEREGIVIPTESVTDTTTFTIDTWEGGVVTMSTATTFSPNDVDPTKNFQGSGSGELKVDAIAGFPKSYSYTERLEGSAQGLDQAVVELIQVDRMFVEFLRL